MDFDVIVAGGGPVGLMLAAELCLGGASVLVLERDTTPHAARKAGFMGMRSINSPTADALHRRGLLSRVREAALWWLMPDQKLDPDAFVGHFAGLPLRAEHLNATRSNVSQSGLARLGGGVIATLDLELILSEWAGSLGAQIRRGMTLVDINSTDDSVRISARPTNEGTPINEGTPTNKGTEERFTARWLVGCDGGRSTVRRLAGFDFPGAEAEFTGRIATVDLADPAALPICGWTRTDTGAYVHGPIPGRVHTVEYGHDPADRDTPVTAEEMAASLHRVTGIPVEVSGIQVGLRYTDATRQASAYRRERVFVAGDAAHIHSPAGGQGLNLGLGDAMNLGWKLAAVVRGGAPAGLLDTYQAERHPLGAWVQGWSAAQSALGRPDEKTKALRLVVRDLLATGDGATYVLTQISGIDRGYDLPGDGAFLGRLAPELMLTDGSMLAEHGRRAEPLLVVSGATDRVAATRAAVHPWIDRVCVLPGPVDLLVRPDGYVVWQGHTENQGHTESADGLTAALTAWVGEPTVTGRNEAGRG